MLLIKKIIIIIIIVINSSFLFSGDLVINEISPENPYIGTEITIKGSGFGNPDDCKVYFNNFYLEYDSLNIIEWTDTKIRLLLPDTEHRTNLIIRNKDKAVSYMFYTRKTTNIEYFNPIKYTLLYKVDVKRIRKLNRVNGKVYVYIPQPIITDELRSVVNITINPQPDYIQDNGVFVYELDPSIDKELIFRQLFEVTTVYKKVNLELTTDHYDYIKDHKLYRFYTRTSSPFIIPWNEDIRNLMREIIGWRRRTVQHNVKLIQNWVVRNMKHTYPIDERDPLWAIENQEGDCLSDAYLFTSLARSARIPIRLNSGYIFYHDDMVTGRHFWEDFYMPGVGWVPLDISYSHNWGFLRVQNYPTTAGFYFGGTDGRRIALSRGRTRLMIPDETGKLEHLKYMSMFQVPHVHFQDKYMNVWFTLDYDIELKKFEKLYSEDEDYFKEENNKN